MVEVIAELGINANGDLGIAKKLIDVAAAAGCDYVKLQKRDIDLVYSREELSKPRESQWGTTTRAQKEGLEFDLYQYQEIDEYCKEKGIKWFLSFWDHKSVKLMTQGHFEFPFVKVPSALITNMELLEAIKKADLPVIVSTGMSDLDEIDVAVDGVLGPQRVYCVMACTSTYPTVPEEINAKCILSLKKLYPWAKIGFSNHYPGLMAMLLAVAYGAEVIEMHITLDRTLPGSDQAASIEPQGLFELVNRIKLIEQMKGDGIKMVFDSEVPILDKLRR
tara:strand:+ start:918 stop:1748 length:831 start_codon:yes stop_codon:yes gene_type:complete